MQMSADGYSTVVAGALKGLETLKGYVQAAEREQERKETLLRQLQAHLEELQKQKESVSQQTRELNTDTALIINELRTFEELEMLDSMLAEKNTQLFLKQGKLEALLQQLTDMEAELAAPSRLQKASQEEDDNSSSASHWKYCCDDLFSQVESINRYSHSQTPHLVGHPVSVFHQSVRKMHRTAREREEEVAIQLKYVDAQLERVSSLDKALGAVESNRRSEVERLQRENYEMIQTMKKVAATEIKRLSQNVQEVVNTHVDLIESMKARGILHMDDALLSTFFAYVSDVVLATSGDQVNASQYDGVDVASEDACNLKLKSAVVLRPSQMQKRVPSVDGTIADLALPPPPPIGGNNTNIHTYNGVGRQSDRYVNARSTVRDPEVEELQSQVDAAERDTHRLQQCYETLREEASRSLCEYETNIKAMEARLSASRNAVEMLMKEKTEWEALQQQMSSLLT